MTLLQLQVLNWWSFSYSRSHFHSTRRKVRLHV